MPELYIKKRNIIIVFFSIVSKILYEIQVLYCLPENYMFGVSFGKDFVLSKIIIGWFIYIVFLFFLIISHRDDFLNYVCEILFLLNFLPVTSSYGLNNGNTVFFILYIIYWLIILIFKNKISMIQFTQKEYKLLFPKMEFNCFILLTSITSLLFIYHYNHFHISFDLDAVYDLRAEMAGNLPTWFTWIKNCFGNVALPLLIVYFLEKKRFLYSLFFILMEIMMFSVGMDKTYILLLIVAIFLGLFKFRIKNSFVIASFGICGVMVLSGLEFLFYGTTMLFYMVVRRTFYLPVWINQMYFDFFSNHEKVLFTQNVFVISKFLPNTYTETIYSLINHAYFNGKVPSPNTGLLAESFMHMGYAGVFVFPILLLFVLRIMDTYIAFLPSKSKFLLAICMGVLISNIPITGGFFVSVWLFSLVVLFLLNKFEKKECRLAI